MREGITQPAGPSRRRLRDSTPTSETGRNSLARGGAGRRLRGDVRAEAHAACSGLEAGGHGHIRRAEDAG